MEEAVAASSQSAAAEGDASNAAVADFRVLHHPSFLLSSFPESPRWSAKLWFELGSFLATSTPLSDPSFPAIARILCDCSKERSRD